MQQTKKYMIYMYCARYKACSMYVHKHFVFNHLHFSISILRIVRKIASVCLSLPASCRYSLDQLV